MRACMPALNWCTKGLPVGIPDVDVHDVPLGQNREARRLTSSGIADGAGKEVHRAGPGGDDAKRVAAFPGTGGGRPNRAVAAGDDLGIGLRLRCCGLQRGDDVARPQQCGSRPDVLGGNKRGLEQVHIGLEVHRPQGSSILVQNCNCRMSPLLLRSGKPEAAAASQNAKTDRLVRAQPASARTPAINAETGFRFRPQSRNGFAAGEVFLNTSGSGGASLQQSLVDVFVACDDRAGLQHVGLPIEIGKPATLLPLMRRMPAAMSQAARPVSQ